MAAAGSADPAAVGKLKLGIVPMFACLFARGRAESGTVLTASARQSEEGIEEEEGKTGRTPDGLPTLMRQSEEKWV